MNYAILVAAALAMVSMPSATKASEVQLEELAPNDIEGGHGCVGRDNNGRFVAGWVWGGDIALKPNGTLVRLPRDTDENIGELLGQIVSFMKEDVSVDIAFDDIVEQYEDGATFETTLTLIQGDYSLNEFSVNFSCGG